jgi:hypothetical protein
LSFKLEVSCHAFENHRLLSKEIAIPLIKTTNAVPFTKGRGGEPDYPVTPKIDDLLKGIDTELKFTLGLIQ